MARTGLVWYGKAGMARLGGAVHGEVRWVAAGVARSCLDRQGKVRQAWFVMAWSGGVWSGLSRLGMAGGVW